MGGTRCIFRDCSVNSKRNPKMHFFKLPLRDSKRVGAWLKNCGKEDILNAPNKKLDCKTVCARHFRMECFMNYKMDRLLPFVTPTLIRINSNLAIDLDNLDENGDAVLVKLEIPTQPHLIAPKDFDCPLGFNDESDCDPELWSRIIGQRDPAAGNQEASDRSRCEAALSNCEGRQQDDQPQAPKVEKLVLSDLSYLFQKIFFYFSLSRSMRLKLLNETYQISKECTAIK